MSGYSMGMTRCWRGERIASSAAFRAGADAYEEAMHAGLLAIAPHDSGVVCLSRGAANAYLVDGDPEAFALMDELGRLRLSVEGGANPNPQLLAEVMVGKVDQLLGLARAHGPIGA